MTTKNSLFVLRYILGNLGIGSHQIPGYVSNCKCHAECQSSMKKVLQYLNIGAIFRSTGEVSSRTDAVPGYSFREVYIHIQHRYRVTSPECQEGESLGGVEAGR